MSEEMSITPPQTPPRVHGGEDPPLDSDSLDYMDFFSSEVEENQLQHDPAGEELAEGPVMFWCEGEARTGATFCPASWCGRGALKWLLEHGDLCPTTLSCPEVAFGLSCNAAYLHQHLSHFFAGLRQAVRELESGAVTSFTLSGGSPSVQYGPLHTQAAVVFNVLVAHLHQLDLKAHWGLVEAVVAEVVDLLLFLGPLHFLPDHVTAAVSPQGNKSVSGAYHLLHLHLDVRWGSLMVLHTVEMKAGRLPPAPPLLQEPPSAAPSSTLQQCVSLVLWDLLTLMWRRCSKKSASELHQVTGFSCSCSNELGVMLLHLLDHRHAQLGKESFWGQVKDKLLILLKGCTGPAEHPATAPLAHEADPGHTPLCLPPSSLVGGIRLPHVWWLFSHLAALYQYDSRGRRTWETTAIKGEPKLLRTLIRLTLTEPRPGQQPTEAELRLCVRVCLELQQLWGGQRSTDWVGALWDYFAKHLDSSFTLPGAGLDAFTCTSKTGRQWLQQVQERTWDAAAVTPSETSWHIFLRIVVGVVGAGSVEWRQMRGRIFSKLHGRRVAELSPTGLHNLVTLFLVLASHTSPLDLSIKLCELLSLVPGGLVNRTRTVWRGCLASLLLLVEAGVALGPVLAPFQALTSPVFQQYCTTRDTIRRRELGELVVVYCEGVTEVFGASHHLSLDQHSLLCGGLSSILTQGGSAEVRAVLGVVEAAVTRLLTLSSGQPGVVGPGMGEAVWREYGGFLRSHSLTLTPPRVMSTLAAALTLCLARDAAPPTREAARTLFSHYLTNETINPKCTLQYIQALLQQPGSLSLLAGVSVGWEVQVVAGWLVAVVVVGGEDGAPLVPLLTTLPSLLPIFPHPMPPTCPLAAAAELVRRVATRCVQDQDMSGRAALQDTALQYFSGLDKAFTTLLKKAHFPDHLPAALRLVEALFFHAHSIIYVKAQPRCVLAGLVTSLLLPPPIYNPDKVLSVALTSALAPTLPKMVCGLGCLGLGHDPYLLRCVRDVFTHYLYRFPLRAPKTGAPHPFIVCLHEVEVQPEVREELQSTFLGAVRDSYLAKRPTHSTHLLMAVSLVGELLARAPGMWLERMCGVLLLPLLRLLLTLEDQTTKRQATDLLQRLLRLAQQQEATLRGELEGSVLQLVAENIAWSSARLFRVLGVVGVLYPALIRHCLPRILQAVTNAEEKRGSGLDQTLRKGYKSLVASVGVEEGEEGVS